MTALTGMEPITSFDGPHRFLSLHFPAPVVLDGDTYRTVRHAYEAARRPEQDYRERIRAELRPSAVIHMTRHIQPAPGWSRRRLDVMSDLNRQKFAQSPLREWLLATGDAPLVFGNGYGDRLWGVSGGRGCNLLGGIIMEIRDELLGGGA